MEALRGPNQQPRVTNKVFLWSTPRSLSTAFERAIMNLKNGKFFHEPFADAYYLGANRKSKRFFEYPVHPEATVQEISKVLLAEQQGKDFIFCKNLAYHLDGQIDALLALKEYKHTFLIRNPNKVIPSLHYVTSPSFDPIGKDCVKCDYFDPEEVGFRKLHEVYEFVVKEFEGSPVIIDADDLLKSSEETMKKYCELTGLVYEENMTTWEPGCVPEWEACKFGWHQNVVKSSGIGLAPKKRNKDYQVNASDKKLITDLISDSLRYYNVFYEKRLTQPSKS